MANLTTIDGFQYSFTPDSVSLVLDHDPNTGLAVTCVFGITAGVIQIAETVDGFLARIGVTNRFAVLSRPNRSSAWINCAAAKSVRAPLPDEYVAGVQAVIAVGSLNLGVTETLAATIAALNANGGNL
ncbi:hypothetical protein [uncultured Sphingomonas sp.]|uniref:hypothetical protein n=1 Tax=uncultured Sphingomonas sp. TaxID=158754 RepID=UPI0015750464